MLSHGMIIVGDGYIEKDCGHHGVSAQRPAASDEYALDRADLQEECLRSVKPPDRYESPPKSFSKPKRDCLD